jgi:hypothetical protein
MKRKKKSRSILPLSPDATDDEIIRWTETYDLGARLDAGVSEIVEIHEGRRQELPVKSVKKRGKGRHG